jgi:hypothetical protein
MGSRVVDDTDIFERIVKYCGLKSTSETEELKPTPITDIGEDIFMAPDQEEEIEKETAPEEPETEELPAGEAEEAAGGIEEALAEIGGGEEPEEAAPEEEGPAEETIEE